MALQQIANTDISSTGTFALGSVSSSTLTSGRVTFAGTSGLLTDSSSLTFNGSTLTASSLSGGNITNSGLTSGRITYASTGGLLVDSANLVFTGTNVGIGTDSPYGLLNIKGSNGQLVLANGNTSGGMKLTASNSIYTGNGYLAFEGYANEYGRFDSSGNFGIGTSSPNTNLHVYATSNALTKTESGTSAASAVYQLKTPDGEQAIYSNNNALIFSRTANFTESMRIDSSGNVGIGISSPTAVLDVLGSFFNGGQSRTNSVTKTFGFRVPHFLTATNPINVIGGLSTTSVNLVYIGGSDSNIGGTAATDLYFYTAANNTTANGTLRMTIDSSGNVGIGTSSPTSKLDVRGNELKIYDSATSNVNLTLRNSTTGDAAGFGLQQDGVNTLLYNGSNGYMSFYTNTSERMRIDSSGNLLVGTTSVNNAGVISIDFDGQTKQGITIDDTYANTGGYYVLFRNSAGATAGYIEHNGTTTVAYNTSSDYRLKENVVPMTDALNKIAQLKPVTYKWKVDGTDGQGFIAHELAEVVPDCVSGEKDAIYEDGSIKPQGIDTSFLVATLVSAIQELKAEFDAYKATHP